MSHWTPNNHAAYGQFSKGYQKISHSFRGHAPLSTDTIHVFSHLRHFPSSWFLCCSDPVYSLLYIYCDRSMGRSSECAWERARFPTNNIDIQHLNWYYIFRFIFSSWECTRGATVTHSAFDHCGAAQFEHPKWCHSPPNALWSAYHPALGSLLQWSSMPWRGTEKWSASEWPQLWSLHPPLRHLERTQIWACALGDRTHIWWKVRSRFSFWERKSNFPLFHTWSSLDPCTITTTGTILILTLVYSAKTSISLMVSMIKFGLKCQQKQQNMEELDFAITQTSHWFSTQNLLLMQLSAIVSRIQRHISIERKFGANNSVSRERWKYIYFCPWLYQYKWDRLG
jgi:hypothetical protein